MCLIPIILRFIELFLLRGVSGNYVTVVVCCGRLINYVCFLICIVVRSPELKVPLCEKVSTSVLLFALL